MSHEGVQRERQTILVVDDDVSVRSFYQRALKLAGYVVVAAEDGPSALQHVEDDQPNAVVMDLGLPRLGGRDLGEELSAHMPHIPVVVVTGSTDDIDEQPFACVLRKPVSVDQLVNAVANCLRQ